MKGLHIATHVPTEDRWTIRVEGLNKAEFREAAAQIEDYYLKIDEKHKVGTTRGRGWKARGRRTTPMNHAEHIPENLVKRTRWINICPFPSSFLNIPKRLRRELAEWRKYYCIVLEGEKAGRYKQNIYILPYAVAPAYFGKIVEANKAIDELNVRIEEYQQSEDFAELRFILRQYGKAHMLDRSWRLSHVSYNAMPLALDSSVVLGMVDTERGTFAEVLKEEELKGMEELEQHLKNTEKQAVVKAIQDIQRKLQPIVQNIVAASKTNPDKVKANLEHLRTLAVSVGLEALSNTVIEPLMVAVDDPEKGFEALFGSAPTELVPAAVDGRIRAFIETL